MLIEVLMWTVACLVLKVPLLLPEFPYLSYELMLMWYLAVNLTTRARNPHNYWDLIKFQLKSLSNSSMAAPKWCCSKTWPSYINELGIWVVHSIKSSLGLSLSPAQTVHETFLKNPSLNLPRILALSCQTLSKPFPKPCSKISWAFHQTLS